MLGKVWKRVLLIILIVACLFDITIKLVKRNSLKQELQATLEYIYNVKDNILAKKENK